MHRLFLCAALSCTTATLAAPVTPARLDGLPEAERTAWRAYLAQSEQHAAADAAALQAELEAHRLTVAVRAPSGGDFRLPAEPGSDWFAGAEAGHLADVVLSFQTPSGGWSKHTGYSQGPRSPGMQWTSQNEPGHAPHYLATFDNRATTEEMHFLAQVWHATQREDCRAGFVRGLEFILAAQYPNGGWPQVYPLEGDYHDHITFNDDAMTRILELLQEVTRNEACYALVEDELRQKATDALAAGLQCLLRLQVVQDGRPTAWCAQYDALTLQPAAARAMEPAALSGVESSRILRFLMSMPEPSPEVVASIEGGLAWLEAAKITGLARTKQDGRTAYEADPDSTEIYWARFYDLADSRPVFPGRDGVIYDSFEAMAAENRLGYDYLSTLPGSVVRNGQKKWRKMLDQSVQSPKPPR